MKLVNTENGKVYEVRSTKKPLIGSSFGGRTWDRFPKMVDGVEVNFYCDTTWGRYMYFNMNLKWYMVSVFEGIFDAEVLTAN